MKKLLLLLSFISLLFSSVDINSATKKELMSLKGIGDKKAELIIEYRKDKCFKDISELI